MTFAQAVRRRDELIAQRNDLVARRKGTTFLDRELRRVTTWLVRYANRQDRRRAA